MKEATVRCTRSPCLLLILALLEYVVLVCCKRAKYQLLCTECQIARKTVYFSAQLHRKEIQFPYLPNTQAFIFISKSSLETEKPDCVSYLLWGN